MKHWYKMNHKSPKVFFTMTEKEMFDVQGMKEESKPEMKYPERRETIKQSIYPVLGKNEGSMEGNK